MWVALIMLILVDGTEVRLVQEDLGSFKECNEHIDNFTQKILETNEQLKFASEGSEKRVKHLYRGCVINPTRRI